MAENDPKPEAKCPHSHLPIAFLKKIGKAVEMAGEDAVKTAVSAALGNLGAFSEE
jgi:hypothetical protein